MKTPKINLYNILIIFLIIILLYIVYSYHNNVIKHYNNKYQMELYQNNNNYFNLKHKKINTYFKLSKYLTDISPKMEIYYFESILKKKDCNSKNNMIYDILYNYYNCKINHKTNCRKDYNTRYFRAFYNAIDMAIEKKYKSENIINSISLVSKNIQYLVDKINERYLVNEVINKSYPKYSVTEGILADAIHYLENNIYLEKNKIETFYEGFQDSGDDNNSNSDCGTAGCLDGCECKNGYWVDGNKLIYPNGKYHSNFGYWCVYNKYNNIRESGGSATATINKKGQFVYGYPGNCTSTALLPTDNSDNSSGK